MADATLWILKSTLSKAIQQALGENEHDADTLAEELFDRCVAIENERRRTQKCRICDRPVEQNSQYCMYHEEL